MAAPSPSALQQALLALNPAQQEAAKHIDGALLILAGAGSGKPKTITTRLAYLVDEVGIPPHSTLTLTFTNKAAEEMRERALSLLDTTLNAPPLLCTFHKFGLIFLRFHITTLERAANFVVLDSADKRSILKSLCNTLPPAICDTYISTMKNSFLSPEEASTFAHSAEDKKLQRVYDEYERYLAGKNLLDFDDLLYLTYKILDKRQDIAQQMSQKYQYVMVDEYQDTNELQCKILKSLCVSHQNLCVVGDDDQSIYGWRGADVRNILRFPQMFDEVKVIKLEENYRSYEPILEIANNLISRNTERLGKNLKSIRGVGEAVRLVESEDENSEAMFLAKDIERLLALGANLSEIAILFRLNALSRGVEEGLNRAQIRYRIIGAMRFYERVEIKALLSYLRLIVNLDDDFSFLNIINNPKRGIGKVRQTRLENLAISKGLSCIATLIAYPKECLEILGKAPYSALMDLVGKLQQWQKCGSFENVITEMEEYLIFTFSKFDEVDREGNIAEFYGKCRDYAICNPNSHIEDFLNDLALASPSDEVVGDAVSCMSIHTAKGLEFKYVYVIGLEDGFFPMQRDEESLQEERRLGYVAFTRAKDVLTLCYAKSRFYKGKREWLKPSYFLKESGMLGNTLLRQKDITSTQSEFHKGMKVSHKLFGVGVIESIQAQGAQYRLKINFGGLQREIISSFVQPLEE